MKDFMKCTRKEQIARWENVLRVLQSLTPHQRRKHFDMSQWGYKNDCGTIACAAGHCSFDPWFRRRGFKGKLVAIPGYCGSEPELRFDDGSVNGVWMENVIERFFGPTEGDDSKDHIFSNETPRSVGVVIREVKARIKAMTTNR